MDPIQAKSVAAFADLAANADSAAALAGRYDCDAGKEPLMWADIVSKLPLAPGMRVLDLGCGCGGLTAFPIEAAARIGFTLDLVDIQPVIAKLQSRLPAAQLSGIGLYAGVFPDDLETTLGSRRYDAILCYSVLQYTAEPRRFVAAAVQLLNSRGRLLLGDLPNVNKKGRFLCSAFGREFEAQYRGIPVADLPHYADHADFAVRSQGQNKAINDALLLDLLRQYRCAGYNAYLQSQPLPLPCSYTREDLIIERL